MKTQLTLKPFWIAKSKDGSLFLIKKNDPEAAIFSIWATKIQPESVKEIDKNAMNTYSFDISGSYFADKSEHGNNLVDSRALKHGERFRMSFNGDLYEFLDIHDLKGIFHVVEHHKSGIDKLGWDKP